MGTYAALEIFCTPPLGKIRPILLYSFLRTYILVFFSWWEASPLYSFFLSLSPLPSALALSNKKGYFWTAFFYNMHPLYVFHPGVGFGHPGWMSISCLREISPTDLDAERKIETNYPLAPHYPSSTSARATFSGFFIDACSVMRPCP